MSESLIPPSDHQLQSSQITACTIPFPITIPIHWDLQPTDLPPLYYRLSFPYLPSLNTKTKLYNCSLMYTLDSFACFQIYHTYLDN